MLGLLPGVRSAVPSDDTIDLILCPGLISGRVAEPTQSGCDPLHSVDVVALALVPEAQCGADSSIGRCPYRQLWSILHDVLSPSEHCVVGHPAPGPVTDFHRNHGVSVAVSCRAGSKGHKQSFGI